MSSEAFGAPPAGHPRQCTATNKKTGERCGNWAAQGAAICRFHGAGASQVQAAARRRLVAADAAKELADLEYEPVEDPVAELADVTARARALMRWFESRLAGAKDPVEADAVLALYASAMDRTARLLEACGRLGLEQRRVQIEEWQVGLCIAAMGKALEEVGASGVEAAFREAFSRYVLELEEQFDPREPWRALPNG